MMSKPTVKAKMIVILDFDGSLFYNPANNLSLHFDLRHIIDKTSFLEQFEDQTELPISESAEYILITGRHISQKEIILKMLRFKGFTFSQSFFNTLDRAFRLSEEEFMLEYWFAKVKKIMDIYRSREYSQVIVIDDDSVICQVLSKLNIPVLKMDIMPDENKDLHIAFSLPNVVSMTEIQELIDEYQRRVETTVQKSHQNLINY